MDIFSGQYVWLTMYLKICGVFSFPKVNGAICEAGPALQKASDWAVPGHLKQSQAGLQVLLQLPTRPSKGFPLPLAPPLQRWGQVRASPGGGAQRGPESGCESFRSEITLRSYLWSSDSGRQAGRDGRSISGGTSNSCS